MKKVNWRIISISLVDAGLLMTFLAINRTYIILKYSTLGLLIIGLAVLLVILLSRKTFSVKKKWINLAYIFLICKYIILSDGIMNKDPYDQSLHFPVLIQGGTYRLMSPLRTPGKAFSHTLQRDHNPGFFKRVPG